MSAGRVYLIGAGPGDPELLTLKGRRILQQADAVLYDHLANSALLALAPAHAERLYVGKKKSDHEFSQAEIGELLIERARRKLTVVRLKGGDPFIFGRGGEEAEALADAGIPFEISPVSLRRWASRHIRAFRSPTASTRPPSPSSPATRRRQSTGARSGRPRPW